MRTRAFTAAFALAGLVFLSACDGGQGLTAPDGGQSSVLTGGAESQGSGSGDGDGENDGPPGFGDSTEDAVVYVVHGISGLDVGAEEAFPVDVQVNETCALEDLTFRDIEGPLTLPPGDYDVKVRAAAAEPCTGDVQVEASGLELTEDTNVSVAAHLDDGGEPALTPFTNDVTPRPGKTRISARHAADFGPVDVRVDGTVAEPGLSNGGQFGAFLRPGEHSVALAPAGSPDPVFETTADFRPFVLTAAYAVGTPDNGTFEVLLQTIEVGPLANGDDEEDGDDDEEQDDEDEDDDDDDEEEEDDEEDEEEDEEDGDED